MSAQEKVEFSRLNGHSTEDGGGGAEDELASMTQQGPSRPTKASKGCVISVRVGLLLLVLVVALTLGVALIVHFSANAKRDSANGRNLLLNASGDAAAAIQQCQELTIATNSCLTLPPHCLVETPEPSPTPAPLITDIFLPPCLRPYHYNVLMWPWIYPDLNTGETDPETFHNYGEVKIFVEAVHPTNKVVLHTRDLKINISSIQIQQEYPPPAPGTVVPKMVSVSNDSDREFFRIHLSDRVTPGYKYSVYMEWLADIDDSLHGFYRSSYTQGGETKWLATTQFQATEARKAFPCFDEPQLKATFNISLKRYESYQTLSNMPIEYTSEPDVRDSGTYVTDHYQQTVQMPTYLLAFFFSQFDYLEDTTSTGVTVRVWSRPDAISQAAYALDVAVRVLEYFENYFNITYPLPKQDMVAVPDFSAGAMENWGLILYRETALLYEEGVSTVFNKQRIAVVVSHELAHQWFGNLVTMRWWDDLWLNEGFASFVEYLGVAHVEPTWSMNEQFLVEDLHRVFRSDSLTTSHPIFVDVKNPNQIREIFDSISYAKGASLIRMMNSFVGEETFAAGLTRYLNEHSYGNANHTDLWNALSTQLQLDGINLNIKEIMDTWLLQMGYPVVTITRDPGENRAHVTQEYFRLDPEEPLSTKHPAPFNYKWMIPLTFVTSQSRAEDWETPEVTWMRKSDVTIYNLDSRIQWILGNVDQTGYYRVNYDKSNWDNLINQLQTNHEVINVNNRAQLVDDSFNLGRAGTISQIIGLRVSEYIDQETEYVVWKAFFKSMTYLDSMLASSPAYGNFSLYMTKKMEARYNEVGWSSTSTAHLDRYLQRSMVGSACKLGMSDCLQQAQLRFQRWRQGEDISDVNPELRTTMYCMGIKYGNFSDWEFVLEKYRRSNVGSEKREYLKSMACSKESWVLNYYVKLILTDSDFRKQDQLSALAYISSSPLGRFLTWSYIRSNWSYMMHTWGAGFFTLQRMLIAVTNGFNTEVSLMELEEFKRQHDDLGALTRTITQVIEETKSNLHWMRHNEQHISDWLSEAVRDYRNVAS